MADRLIRYEVTEGICTLTLDNPERRNGWSRTMEEQYFDSLDQAAADESVRVIVVTGAGSTFCPGLDASLLSDAATSSGVELSGRRSQHHALTVPKPMLAAINGACAGIGLVQALVCDVRFMARGARLSTAYAKLGVPAEYGLSWLLPRMIGIEWALDLLLSSRPVEADEAEEIGLVSRVCEPGELLGQTYDYAFRLASGSSPRSMAAIRRQVWGDLGRSYPEANAVWLDTMAALGSTDNPDFAEGVSAFVERRPPRFGPLPAEGLAGLPALPPFVAQ